MNTNSALPPQTSRRSLAAARRERILSQFRSSGLSAYAFARKQPMPYTTLIQWLKRPRKASPPVTFAEIQVTTSIPEPLVLEIGSHTRVRLTSQAQLPLVLELLKHLQA